MSDPLSLLMLGAAVGGATGKFTEIAVETGKLWIGNYFSNHQPKAQEKAQQNGLDFLVELGARIKILENNQTVTQEKIIIIQEDPDFSAALQKALLSSAQTENKEKHKVLAELLTQRLTVESESLLALTTKMALDVISFLTPKQLNVLAFTLFLYGIIPTEELDSTSYGTWIIENIQPYIDLRINEADLMHLESLSCLKITHIVTKPLHDIFHWKNYGTRLNSHFYITDEYKKLEGIWNQSLQKVDLTSVGYLIGLTIFNLNSNQQIKGALFQE